MAPKEIYSTPKESGLPPLLIPGVLVQEARTISEPQHTTVRHKEEIPNVVWNYFKIDPRNSKPLNTSEKLLHAQVLMHEVDEGVRLLRKAGLEKDANILSNFSNKMHINSRLEILRRMLDENNPKLTAPQRVHRSNKARNNQYGATKARLGHHPAVVFTESGIGYKDCNEDAFLLLPSQKVIALADGMGGHVGGNIASCIAIDFFEYGMRQAMPLEVAINYSNEAILIRSQSDSRLGGMHPMGCTFASIQIKHSKLEIAHVGDTKVMVIRNGEIVFQTQDHTKGQQLLKDGIVDLATAFELNHILNRCLGLDRMQAKRDVAIFSMELEPGDRVVMLTDGITDNFYDSDFSLKDVGTLVSDGALSRAADLIVDACHNFMLSQTLPCGRQAKPDNLSLGMVEYRG